MNSVEVKACLLNNAIDALQVKLVEAKQKRYATSPMYKRRIDANAPYSFSMLEVVYGDESEKEIQQRTDELMSIHTDYIKAIDAIHDSKNTTINS